MSPKNFVEKCLSGEALADDIDDYVDEWHDGGTGAPLWKFLGFTKPEYKLWAEKPNSLRFILNARRSGEDLESVIVNQTDYRAAARSLSPEDAEELMSWLKATGRITD